MEQITIPAADAVAIASLATFTANPKDGTPVLAEIEVSVTGSQLTAYGTDRYTAAEYRAELPGAWHLDTVTFRLSATAAKFLTSNVKKLNKWSNPGGVTFTVDQEARTVEIAYNGATLQDAWTAFKYPDIAPLLADWQPAPENNPVKLNANFLARLGKLLDAFTKLELWVLQTGAARFNPDKPGPVMATAGNYRVLIMPNLIK